MSTNSSQSSIALSHRKDADGICSGALIAHLTGAQIYLTDYGDMVETMSQLGKADQYYISDLGLNKNTFHGFLDQIKRLSQFGRIHYFDHHPLSEEFRTKLASTGIEMTHSVEECASVLVYKKYAEEFKNSPQMKIAACCGAITDYMDLQPYAKKLVASFDRQFLLYEATVLAFTIASVGRGSQNSNSMLVRIAQEISQGKFAHELEGASDYAQGYVARSAELISSAKKFGKKVDNHFAYMVTTETSTGNVANFLVGAFDVPVGVAIREEEPGYYEISTRSIEESKHDLGKILGRIASTLGTSGGGHPHAAGARIRRDQFQEFIELLDKELGKSL